MNDLEKQAAFEQFLERLSLEKLKAVERLKDLAQKAYLAPGRAVGRNAGASVEEAAATKAQMADLSGQAQKEINNLSGQIQNEGKAFSELGKGEFLRHLTSATKQVAPGMAAGTVAGGIGGAFHDDSRAGAARGMLAGALGGIGGRALGPGMGRAAIGGGVLGGASGALFGKDKEMTPTNSKPKKKVATRNKYAGVTLDLFDDNGTTLKGVFPTPNSLPQFIKEADVRSPHQLYNEDFALVALDEGRVMRKYACHDPGTTAMSVIYFMEHGHKLPAEAQKMAAVNLVAACESFGLEPPDTLVTKMAFLGRLPSWSFPAAATAVGAGTGAAVAGEDRRLQGALLGGGLGLVGGLGAGVGASALGERAVSPLVRRAAEADDWNRVIKLTRLKDRVFEGSLAAGLGAGGAGGGLLAGKIVKKRPMPEADMAAHYNAQEKTAAEETLSGGKADGMPNSDFNPEQIAKGQKVEMEHTKNRELALEIARDHLTEIPDYYDRLDAMEEAAMNTGEKNASNFVDITGKSAPPISKVAMPTNDSEYAVVLEGGQRYYPIDTWDRIKLAEQYYQDEGLRLNPEHRRQFAEKLAAKSLHVGYPLDSRIQEAGASTYAPRGHMQEAVDMRKVACAPGQDRQFLDELLEKSASLPPKVYAEVLRRFDVDHGLERGWDQLMPNPWASTYGINKEAEVVWEQGPDRVTGDELVNLGRNHSDQLDHLFSEMFAQEFQKNPVVIFKSLPDPQKKLVARLANDMSSRGGSEFQETKNDPGTGLTGFRTTYMG